LAIFPVTLLVDCDLDAHGRLVSNCTLGVPEANEHCPQTPGNYHDAKGRALGKEQKKASKFGYGMFNVEQELRQAAAEGMTAAKWLSNDRGKSFVARLAKLNGIPLSADTLARADYSDERLNPLKRRIISAFVRYRKHQVRANDDKASVDAFIKAFDHVKGIRIVHQQAAPESKDPALRAEIIVIGASDTIALAHTHASVVLGFDAGFGFDAYGHRQVHQSQQILSASLTCRHWEIVGRNSMGSGHPMMWANTSDGTQATQAQILRMVQQLISEELQVCYLRLFLRLPFVF
jgi:hypothetical protein